MFGGGLSWFYNRLAGLQPTESQTGYKQIVVKAMPVSELTFAKYYTETIYELVKIGSGDYEFNVN